MGKFKVNFTTALFVFSFIICVIVAVVFVDRAPKNDYDSFYDEGREGETANKPADKAGMTAEEWAKRNAPATAAATPSLPAEDPNAVDLPLDPHLLSSVQAITGTPDPSAATAGVAPGATATPNYFQGRSPEEISRALLNQGMPRPIAPGMPAMAVPAGIGTPMPVQSAESTPAPRTPATYLPVQSNSAIGASTGGGASTGAFPSPGYGSSSGNVSNPSSVPSLSDNTNAGGANWNQISPKATPFGALGVRAAPASSENGMMISDGRSKTGVAAPAGFTNEVTQDPASPLPGTGNSSDQLLQPMQAINGQGSPSSQQYLLQPEPSAAEKYQLPPAPTLRPPPITDPDQRRGDADTGSTENQTPGNANPETESDQAVAVSGPAVEPAAEDKPVAIAARVNDVELTEADALKLATANALISKKPLSEETRRQQIDEAVKNWTAITAAAEAARAQNLTVAPEEVEKYAAMKPGADLAKWQQTLTESGFSNEEVQQRMTEVALSEKLVDHKLAEKYPEKELKQVYEKTPKAFARPRQVRVLEIFKKLPEDEAKAKRVEEEMKRLQRQASAGTDFGLLARQASEAGNKRSGGDHGWITPSEDKESLISKSVEEMKTGEVSQVIESDDGFRIYKIVEDKPARDDFEGGKELVIKKLKEDLRDKTYADARNDQNVELSPKGKLITAKNDKAQTEKKDSPKSKSEDKPAAKEVAVKPEPKTSPGPVADPTPDPTPNRQTFAAAPTNQLLYAPGAQPQAQYAGGAPAPPSQPGGQTPVPADATMTNGYRPGTTIHIGEPAASVMNPAPSTTVNYVASNSPAPAGMTDQQHQQALASEAQLMRTQAEARSQAEKQALEIQINQMRQQEAARLNPGEATSQQLLNIGAEQQPPAAAATPEVTVSNNWTVTKTNPEAASPAANPQPAVPGFGASVAPAAPGSAPAAEQTAVEPEKKGFFSGVRSMFRRD